MDDKSSAAGHPSGAAAPENVAENGAAKGGQRVSAQRRFKLEDLPRDEDGKVVLPDDITYPEFIRLTHPEMTDAEVDRAVRKEQRSARLARIEILAFVLLVIAVIVLIVAS